MSRRLVGISTAWSGRPVAIDLNPPDAVGDRRPPRAEVLCFGDCRLDRAMGLLHVDGVEVWLPPKALAVLEYLVERPSAVVSRAELLAAAWGESAVTDHSLTEAIRILRRELGDDHRRPRYIQTVHKRGYRLVAEIVPSERGVARFS
ncbi:MAG: transcriptional regulator [Acidobacteriota bacterium]|jgi:DNA-binding winged helix-turn-helix (wHTH) protein